MYLYHGSTSLVKVPEIRSSETYLDFGPGFYTTSSYEQAERWAKIKMRREGKQIGYVAKYAFDAESAKQALRMRRFPAADQTWLMFVVRNRRGELDAERFDMNIGPVADDNVYQSIRLFETGILNEEETVRRLKTEVLHDQWTFHSAKALQFCRFLSAREVK